MVGLACAVVASAAGPDAIAWRTDPVGAREEAQAAGRLLLIQFTGPWCHNCLRLERETLVDPKVVGLARDRFIPVRLRSDVHEELAVAANLTGIPATLIVRPSGEVLARHEGFVDAATFSAFLESSLDRFDPSRRQLAAAPPEAAATAAGDRDGVALAGYCPVSLVADRRLVPGRDAVTLEHDGRVYRFASARLRSAFQKQPERYVPVNGGRCPVMQVDRGESLPGDPRWGVLYQGHLYLCRDEQGRARFLKSPERYAHVDVADRGFCPHCWGRDGLLVRGWPQHSLTRGGRRYLFPGPDHLEAFRDAPDPEAETARR